MTRLAKGYEPTEPWIGVDMDGTFARYDETWLPWNKFGPPIPPMIDRMKGWLSGGRKLRIVTARVYPYVHDQAQLGVMNITKKCLVTGQSFTIADMLDAIGDYTEKHVGARLGATCAKDYQMLQLWDDRAVQVVPNTGRTLAEEHDAIVAALQGKAQG